METYVSGTTGNDARGIQQPDRERLERELLLLVTSESEFLEQAKFEGLSENAFRTPSFGSLWAKIKTDGKLSTTDLSAIGKLERIDVAEGRVFELIELLSPDYDSEATKLVQEDRVGDLVLRSPRRVDPPVQGRPAQPDDPRLLPYAATGKLAALRLGKRKEDLLGVFFHFRGAVYKQQFRRSPLFFDWLRQRLGNRDPLDRELVEPVELGKLLGLTFADILEIEAGKTEFRRQEDNKRGRTHRKPFRLTTIAVIDMNAKELQRRRRKIRDRQMHTEMGRANSHVQAIAAQTERTRAQMEALYDAFGDKEYTPKDFETMVSLNRHPAWRDVSSSSLYQTIITRLDTLEEEGRIVTVRRDKGPRGSMRRVMRRT
jgi:hypothetical protein